MKKNSLIKKNTIIKNLVVYVSTEAATSF
jgi:hypothetical protein